MASYNILWKTSASHDLRKLDRQYIPQILTVIETLTENPFPVQSRKLQGSEASKIITIYYVRHRREVYR